jgi:hypothetical protein
MSGLPLLSLCSHCGPLVAECKKRNPNCSRPRVSLVASKPKLRRREKKKKHKKGWMMEDEWLD